MIANGWEDLEQERRGYLLAFAQGLISLLVFSSL